MRKRLQRIVLLVLTAALLVTSGCGVGIRFTTGLSDHELFKLNKDICTSSEAMVFVLNQKKKYETTYSQDVWAVSVEGKTFEQIMKKSLEDFLARMKSMVLMADSYHIVLSEEEERRLSLAAETYMAGIPEETKEKTGLTEGAVRQAFSDYFLANKVMTQMTQAVNTEISEDEARIVKYDQIFIKTADKTSEQKTEAEAKAAKLLEDLTAGADFTALQAVNNESLESTLSLARGEADPRIEQIVFGLSNGQVSELIRTEEGMYLIRCISNYDPVTTAENKEKMIRSRKEEAFHQYYDEFLKTIIAEYNEKAWDLVSYAEDYGDYSADFYEIYRSILE